VKYNVQGGKVLISGTEDDSRVTISILDIGIGIKSDILYRIWDELFVCDSSQSDPVSKGLGLCMVKNLSYPSQG